jgi:stage II sporulation protein R
VYPEGEYLSLRIFLGKGKGHNWWCVLFPSLGNVGVEYETEKDSKKEIEIFGCKVRLKILEYFD